MRNRFSTPPMIRVFLSSTFLDMEQERHYFNTVLVPEMSRMCHARGVSFFSIDLRWGITEEDQISGKVIPICLREIDLCRPYFIGMVGNRYGSVPEDVTPDVIRLFPWLEGKIGKSVTELEMLYGVLDRQKQNAASDCIFMLRDDALTAEMYPAIVPEDEEKAFLLRKLKETIRNDADVPVYDYRSMDEFGKGILEAFSKWLTNAFPQTDSIHEVRSKWYDSELHRDYIPNRENEQFLDYYVQNSRKPLMIYGDGGRGKTTLLTNWEPEGMHKILINSLADSDYTYWPSILRKIIVEINNLDESYGMPDMKVYASFMFQMFLSSHKDKEDTKNADKRSGLGSDFYLVTDSDQDSFKDSVLTWMENLSLKEPVCIVINDLNCISDPKGKTLYWLPVRLPENLYLICSTNDEEIIDNADLRGWNCKEAALFSESETITFLNNSLRYYGKNLNDRQKNWICHSELMRYPGFLKYIVRFLCVYGSFENMDKLTEELGAVRDPQEMYACTIRRMTDAMSEEQKEVAKVVLAILRNTSIALSEQECYDLTSRIAATNPVAWSAVHILMEQLQTVKGEYWNMDQEELQKYTDSISDSGLYAAVNSLLGDYFYKIAEESDSTSAMMGIRVCTEFSKAALKHYRAAENYDKVIDVLRSHRVLWHLSKLDWADARAAWMDVLLHTDADVPAILLEILQEEKNRADTERSNDSKIIMQRVASLFPELELETGSDKAEQIIGHRLYNSFVAFDLDESDESFAPIYDHIVELKNQNQFNALYQYFAAFMGEKGDILTNKQLCAVLPIKLENELNMGRYGEALETANRFYNEAVVIANLNYMCEAQHMRGQTLYFNGDFQSAEKSMTKAIHLARLIGNMRAFLACRNILGMCYYRAEEFDKSASVLEETYAIWEKLGNYREALVSAMNATNAYYLQGDPQKARDRIRQVLEKTEQYPDDPLISRRRMSLLGNLGTMEKVLENYSEAEKAFLETLRNPNSDTNTRINSYGNLISMYDDNREYINAIDLLMDFMDFLLKIRDYKRFSQAVKLINRIMAKGDYREKHDEMVKRFGMYLDLLSGTSGHGRKSESQSGTDALTTQKLEQQILIAEGEHDAAKKAVLQEKLARLLDASKSDQKLGLFLEASRNTEIHNRCIGAAFALLLAQKDPVIPDRVFTFLDQTEQEIANYLNGLNGAPQKRGGFLSRFLSKGKKAPGSDLSQSVMAIAKYADRKPEAVTAVMRSLAKRLAHEMDAESTIELLSILKAGKTTSAIQDAISKEYTDSINQHLISLKTDYQSEEASRLLAFYEKAVAVLSAVGNSDAAAIAGNIALIFRRRQDKEKTYKYHRISQEIYKRDGNIYDSLIEGMNLATAYQSFGDIEKAIEMNRSNLADAQKANEKRMAASIAGNLANQLMRNNGDAKEISSCFDLEESYFTEKNEYRELAISLYNQIIWNLGKNSPDISAAKSKFNKFKEIVTTQKLSEFYPYVHQMSILFE